MIDARATKPASVILTRPVTHPGRGFALVEVLIALAVFTIGFIAVAAPIFVAVRIQSQTIDEVQVQQTERNAEALMRARKLEYGTGTVRDFNAQIIEDGRVRKFTAPMMTRWSISDRSRLSTVTNALQRRYYWVPLIRSTKTPATGPQDWQVFVFIMRRGEGQSYPKTVGIWANDLDPDAVPGVRRVIVSVAPGNRFRFNFSGNANDTGGDGRLDLVRPGDQVLGEFGNIYTVIEAEAGWFSTDAPVPLNSNPSFVWLVPPAGDTEPSPVRAIRLLPSDVVQ